MYTHVEKYTEVEIWRKGLSGLKQDGPKRYLGAGQHLLEHFSQKGRLANNRQVQLNGRLSTNAQTMVRSDYQWSTSLKSGQKE